MRVLVAGAAGYLGQNLVQVLHAKGHEVVGLDVRPDGLEPLRAHLADSIGVDLLQPERLRGCCDGVEVVISTVGLELPTRDLSYWDVDYRANLNLLREAERAGVEKLVYVSVIHADRAGVDLPPMVAAKRAFEQALMGSGLKWVILRPTGYFKDIVNIFLRMARKGTVRMVGSGEVRCNPLHPADFSEFIAESLGLVNVIREVGGPEVYSYNDLGRLAFEAVERPARFSYMPPSLFTAFSKAMRLVRPRLYPVLQFSQWCMTNDMTAPPVGSHHIRNALHESAGTSPNAAAHVTPGRQHRIFLAGGTGGVGARLLEQALAAGQQVVVYARRPERVRRSHPNLQVVMGELDDIEAMRIGMRGCDAVVCTVGVLERRPNTILSDGTRNLLKVAAEEEIRRVLVVTTLGLGDTRDQAHPLFRYLVRPVIRHSFADKERQEQAVMRSDLDWTLVRPAALTNGERTGAYRHGQDRSIRGRISRRDVADFLLRQLDDESYVRRAVAVAY